jgi:hypothetical protein
VSENQTAFRLLRDAAAPRANWKAIVGQLLQAFQEFPPRQKPGSFSIDQAMEKLMNQKSSN